MSIPNLRMYAFQQGLDLSRYHSSDELQQALKIQDPSLKTSRIQNVQAHGLKPMTPMISSIPAEVKSSIRLVPVPRPITGEEPRIIDLPMIDQPQKYNFSPLRCDNSVKEPYTLLLNALSPYQLSRLDL